MINDVPFAEQILHLACTSNRSRVTQTQGHMPRRQYNANDRKGRPAMKSPHCTVPCGRNACSPTISLTLTPILTSLTFTFLIRTRTATVLTLTLTLTLVF